MKIPLPPFGLRHRNKDITLKDVPESGLTWTVSNSLFGELEAAHFWKMNIEQFDEMTEEGKILSIAYMQAKKLMEMIDAEEAKKRAAAAQSVAEAKQARKK